MRELLMPQLALGDEEAKITAWLKSPGDSVVVGEPLLEVDTDKATMEVESPYEGVLAAVLLRAGGNVSAGTLIGYVADPGEEFDAEELTARGAEPARTDSATEQVEVAIEAEPPSPHERPALVERGELGGLPTRRAGAASATRVSAPARPPTVEPPAPPSWERPVEAVTGAFSERRLGRRRTSIARRMTHAVAIPQFAITRDIELEAALTGLEAARAVTGATVSDVIIKAAADAAVNERCVNAWLLGDTVIEFEHANVAIAVDRPDGVLVPVIRTADTLSLRQIARVRRDLTERAHDERLTMQDLAGATFTVSNVGPLGADALAAVITPPQVAVLATGRVREMDGRKTLAATLVADHRALDGGDGARFLAAFATALESVVFD